MNRMLRNVRISLGMDMAFISEFRGELKHFRYVDFDITDPPIHQGQVVAVSNGYCEKVVLGHLPEMIPDTRLNAVAMEVPETTSMPIGSHMSVPLRLSDGSIYGTLCCFSYLADPTLNARELRMLQAIANLVASEIDAHSLALREKQARSDAVLEAIDAGYPQMVFQPILRLADQTFMGAEALARFPAEPFSGPVEWFSWASDCGHRCLLETAAIRNAIRDYEPVWRVKTDAVLALNVSAETIIEGDIGEAISGARPDLLILEITEHDQIDNYDALTAALAPLRNRGVRVAVDDAGSGYASLHHVVRLTPDVIKLDISLTKAIDQDRTRIALATAFLEFARQTGSVVVAEGIETPAELAVLTGLGIHLGQGYLLAKPTPAPSLAVVRN